MQQDRTLPIPGNPVETRRLQPDVFARDCPTRQLLDRVADKWSALIMLTLGNEPMRFNGLRRRIQGISQKMLSQTLRSLERDGLVTRSIEATVPVTVTYAITPLGRGLLGALQSMTDWAEACMIEVAAAQNAYDKRQENL